MVGKSRGLFTPPLPIAPAFVTGGAKVRSGMPELGKEQKLKGGEEED